MTPDRPDDGLRDDVVRAAYRRAAETLDERPDPAVRGRVLAAAAHAASPRTAPFGTRRWPLSAAAVVVVSVMAGLLVTHVARDEPERMARASMADVDATVAIGPPPASTRSAVRTEANVSTEPARVAAAPVRRPAAPLPPDPARAEAAPVQTTTLAKTDSAAVPPSVEATGAAKVMPPADVRSSAPASAAAAATAFPHEASRPVAAAPAPAPWVAEPPPTAASAGLPPDLVRSADATNPVAARSRLAGQAVRSDDEPAADRVARAAPSTAPGPPTMRQDDAMPEPATPADWVERIVALRAAGRAAEADLALATLRRRHPEFVVPASALGPTGTR